ncbi:MAG: hypothetical protein KU37_10570 [Sulfuricurvum sp. PC08-66]|nr:MAG: hypothetical protein KU37_10570 [Sulfuricurvum sp. PC08-66]
MSEQSAEVQSQINLIKQVVVGKSHYRPYKRSSLMVWGVLSVVLILFPPMVLQHFGLGAMGLFLVVFLGIGIGFEVLTFRRTNKRHEITATPTQRFITTFWILGSIFSLLVTVYATKYEHIELIYPMWIFTVGLTNFLIGFFFDSKAKAIGLVSIAAAFGVLIATLFVDGMTAYTFGKYTALLFLSGSTIAMGFYMPREEARV